MRVVAALVAASALGSATPSAKRGLCFTPNKEFPDDNKVWTKPGSDLNWYYNYGSVPSPAFSGMPQDRFEFVPMMWGVVDSNLNDTSFLNQVKKLMQEGTAVRHVLGFNEPDAVAAVGGSSINPKDAAQAWVANFEPLGQMGIKLGLPACTGGWGSLPWLKQFLGNCSDLVSSGKERKNCTWHFLPVHWYDNYEGLVSHIQERRATWPNAEIWVTEYAYAHQDLGPTQEFYNRSAEYLDRHDYVGRYSYFGAFRAEQANVGPNAAFLSNGGQLTDIGSWYLGGGATGVSPQSAMASRAGPSVALVGAGLFAWMQPRLF